MNKAIRAIAIFLGVLLKELLPTLIAEWKKPRKTKYLGDDDEVRDSMSDQIEQDAIDFSNKNPDFGKVNDEHENRADEILGSDKNDSTPN